jgi:hypothetical protein
LPHNARAGHHRRASASCGPPRYPAPREQLAAAAAGAGAEFRPLTGRENRYVGVVQHHRPVRHHWLAAYVVLLQQNLWSRTADQRRGY